MNDLDWLTERRPETPDPDFEATTRARRALLAHAAGEGDKAAPWGDAERAGDAAARWSDADRAGGEAAPWGDAVRVVDAVPAGGETARAGGDAPVAPARRARPERRGRGRRRTRGGVLALALVAALALVVAAGSLPSGDGPGRRLGAPEVAVAAPLVRLSARIQAAPAPPGDATLVLRSHDFPTAKDFTGADLYLDDGRYFYAPTRGELRDAPAQEPQGQRQIAAATAALALPGEQARARMIDATWAPGPRAKPADDDAAPQRKREAILKRDPSAEPTPTPAPQRLLDDNRVWMGSMDALIAGAGRADVRAGVMKLLATIPDVKVTERGELLELRNTGFSDGYVETLSVDAKTGVLRSMTGGDAGKPPTVVVDYDIKRVDAKDVLK